MSYTALYRQYRPTTFDEVVEQNHITTSLTNQIKNGQIGHAYLFCGTRGTGKTSIARIFARAINCKGSKNGNPCGKCENCKNMSLSGDMDIIEIDAASNNKVEEIRDLIERVKYPPVNGKYKVYIIDEVHMLTDSAFNALLKTLEEPPEYVVFILGTTEVQKLPATILSRCLRFDFKLISNEGLENHLKRIFKDSKIDYEDEAISLIARLGQGSVRDMLSIADMCVAYSNKHVTYKSVVEAVGTTDMQVLQEMALSIIEKNSAKILEITNAVSKNGKNLSQLAKDLVGYFRDLTVVKTCKNYVEILKYPSDIVDGLKKLADKADVNDLLSVMGELGGLEQAFRYTQNARALLEVTLLSIVNAKDRIEKLEKRVLELEKQLSRSGEKAIHIMRDPEILVEPGLNYFDAKEIWGKLLIALKERNEIRLYLICNSAKHTLTSGVLTISVTDDYDALIEHKDILSNILITIEKKLKLKICKAEEKKEFNVLEFLRKEFGDKLIIEGDK